MASASGAAITADPTEPRRLRIPKFIQEVHETDVKKQPRSRLDPRSLHVRAPDPARNGTRFNSESGTSVFQKSKTADLVHYCKHKSTCHKFEQYSYGAHTPPTLLRITNNVGTDIIVVRTQIKVGGG